MRPRDIAILAATLLTLRAVGCSGRDDAPVVGATDDPDARRASDYLALGDSYTIGEGVARRDRWPVQLAAALRAGGAEVADPRIVATTGWTCADLSDALDREPAGKTYRLVSLLIGVNDQYRGGTPEAYRVPFDVLLKRAIALAGGEPRHVVVLNIPDWGATPFGHHDPRGSAEIGRQVDAFNAVSRDATHAAGVHYVDVVPASREVSADPTLAVADGLHPSAAMYAKWMAAALPDARDAVGTKADAVTAR